MQTIQSAAPGWGQWRNLAVLGVTMWLTTASLHAQTPALPNVGGESPKPPAVPQSPAPMSMSLPALDLPPLDTGCSTCGSGGSSLNACGARCIPGHTDDCATCEGSTKAGRLCSSFFSCICCPDPCYEGHWNPVADSAFFVDAARPKSQMDLVLDSGFGTKGMDRAEYMWAKEGTAGPKPGKFTNFLNYETLDLYMEVASERFSAFVSTPYTRMDPAGLDVSGFSDVTVGTKSMLLDCELMQATFEFKTFIPAGSASSGLGTGHVSLEPSLLYTLKLCTDTYMQGQTAYWIALPGDVGFKGTIIHNHISFNRALCRPCSKILLVGTLEFNEWSVLSGSVTDVNGTTTSPSRSTIVSAGPGIRTFICDKFDVGIGTAFALTGEHWADQLARAEFRWRF